MPSPFKSDNLTDSGVEPAPKETLDLKVPLPLPCRILIVPEPESAVTTSKTLSPFTSAKLTS
jgi:hypothetical protein